MDEQQLREHLQQLDTAINNMQASEADKEQLRGLIDNVENQLADPLLNAEADSLVDQVDSMVTSFEAEHPTISGILNNIMVTLSSMGV